MSTHDLTVLVVDDDPETVRIFEYFLQKQDYIPVIAGTVGEALDRMQEIRPDVVLLDLMLPYENGTELLKHIRTTPGYEDVYVIIISAHAPEDQHMPTGISADMVLRKPVRIPDLANALTSAFA